jgi:hypothetical protein
VEIKTKIQRTVSAPKTFAYHVYRNRGRYCFATGIIVGGVVTRNLDNDTYKEAMAFLELKGLKDEFFTPTEYDWSEML